jgi:hypothetical protein
MGAGEGSGGFRKRRSMEGYRLERQVSLCVSIGMPLRCEKGM